MLTGWLEQHRGIVAWKCADLTAGQLRRRAVSPSALPLPGLARHMAGVRRGWFRQVFPGQNVPGRCGRPADEEAGFNGAGQAGPAGAFRAFERGCAVPRQVAAQAAGLDVRGRQAPERTGQPWSLRWIVTRLIEEYARRNGHAGLLRERGRRQHRLLLSVPGRAGVAVLTGRAALTRPPVGDDLGPRSRRLTGSPGAARRRGPARHAATGKWAAVNSASCRGPRSGHRSGRGPHDLATPRPGHAIRRIARMNPQGAPTIARDGDTAALYAGSPPLSLLIAVADRPCVGHRTSGSAHAIARCVHRA
jgi:Protein of unknown function (DUF664)